MVKSSEHPQFVRCRHDPAGVRSLHDARPHAHRDWRQERRLAPDERRAARSERAVLEQLRRERDYDDPRARQLEAVEAERRRWSYGLRFP